MHALSLVGINGSLGCTYEATLEGDGKGPVSRVHLSLPVGWWQEQGAQQAIPWAQETEPSKAKSKSSVTFCVNSSCFTAADTCSLRVSSLCADTRSSAYNSQKSSGEVEAVAWSIDGNNRRGGDAVRHVRAVERGVEPPILWCKSIFSGHFLRRQSPEKRCKSIFSSHFSLSLSLCTFQVHHQPSIRFRVTAVHIADKNVRLG